MAESPGTNEPATPAAIEQPKWRWEVIKNPKLRSKLISDTIEERILQKVTGASGYAELVAMTGVPRIEAARQQNALRARDEANLAAEYLRALQRVINMDPNQPLPIDRQTTRGNTRTAVIELSELTNPTQAPQNISRRRWSLPWLRRSSL